MIVRSDHIGNITDGYTRRLSCFEEPGHCACVISVNKQIAIPSLQIVSIRISIFQNMHHFVSSYLANWICLALILSNQPDKPVICISVKKYSTKKDPLEIQRV